jgi:uroporphyrinogen III methyltransferase/synthase
VAAVRWGTRPEQETTRATLATIGSAALSPPSTIVIGEVAAQDLAWFESRPLFGLTVAVTRARHQSSDLVAQLRDLGAATVEVPVIRVEDPADGGRALRAALADVRRYGWLVLTSANAVTRSLSALGEQGLDVRALGSTSVAAIGPGTAAAMAAGGIRADLVPDRFVAEALLDAFPAPDGAGRVLLARAAVARDVLPDGLRAKGWEVDVVEAYRTVPAELTDDQRAAARRCDVITFTSSSTVVNALAALGEDHLPPTVACIGPVTAATARDMGLAVDIEAPVHTIGGLVDAIVEWASARSPGQNE